MTMLDKLLDAFPVWALIGALLATATFMYTTKQFEPSGMGLGFFLVTLFALGAVGYIAKKLRAKRRAQGNAVS